MTMFHRVPKGKALIRCGVGGTSVHFGSTLVIPIIHGAELIDLTTRRIRLSCVGKKGLICKDCIRADLTIDFLVHIDPSAEAVLQVHLLLGSVRANDPGALEEIFQAKFHEALKTIAKKRDFDDLQRDHEGFEQAVHEVIGDDLHGFVLQKCTIDGLEETPLKFLDPSNILDAEGIKKITERQAHEESVRLAAQREQQKAEAIAKAEAKHKAP